MRTEIGVALKEWSAVTDALRSGRQTLLLRKGGIAERRKGFVVEHQSFLLYPSYAHQQIDFVKPEAVADYEKQADPGGRMTLRFDTYADVVYATPLIEKAQAYGLGAYHIWNERFINQRLAWRPEEPVWLLVLRAFELAEPIEVEALRRYAGCRSWVNLERPVLIKDAKPVLGNLGFEKTKQDVLNSLEASRA